MSFNAACEVLPFIKKGLIYPFGNQSCTIHDKIFSLFLQLYS